LLCKQRDKSFAMMMLMMMKMQLMICDHEKKQGKPEIDVL